MILAEVSLTSGVGTPIYRRGWSLIRRYLQDKLRKKNIELLQERVVFHYSGLLEANQWGGYISRTGQVSLGQ